MFSLKDWRRARLPMRELLAGNIIPLGAFACRDV
jgi:hypothetical protein